MTLSHVTFTGWDRHTDLVELQTFLEEQPQTRIEIAVLFSASRSLDDEDRYPDPAIAADILRTAKAAGQRTALHLCGQTARRLIDSARGQDLVLPWNAGALVHLADRVQVNVDESFWIEGRDKYRPAYDLARLLGRPFIVQTRDINTWPSVEHLGADADRMVTFLFDRSAGQGKSLLALPVTGEPRSFPTPALRRTVGYAGGLRPVNVGQFMSRIYTPRGRDERYWIDMETGIREQFPNYQRRSDEPPPNSYVSLMKCRQVMDEVSQYFEGAS